jgi:tetrapyrrole methylase family protein/MazG family protein
MFSDAPASFERLYEIIRRLRGPGGCPWDLAQTPETLRTSLVDEVWECVSAVDSRDDRNLEEELGDLYLLVTMVSWMKEQEGAFTVASTLEHISDKLVRRHPHVFGSGSIDASRTSEPAPPSRPSILGVDGVLAQWDEIKKTERKDTAAASVLDRVPGSLPPLEMSAELQKKAAKTGFDWPGPEPVWKKIEEEMGELREAIAGGDARKVEDEVGDLLFSVVNLARLLKVNSALALHGTNRKFERRFREVERLLAAEGTSPKDAGLARMDELWNQVKTGEAAGPGDARASK